MDSAVAALLCLRQEMRVVGVTLEMSGSTPDAAAVVCDALDMEHRVIDASDLLERCVVEPFVEAWAQGMTPNPCVRCNATVKLSVLIDVADETGCERIVTGHYARVLDAGDAVHLLRACDRSRDQSYMLYRLTQEALHRLSLPLGELRKTRVRELAADANLPAADRPESQDVCFLPDGEIAHLVARSHPEAVTPGPILDRGGRPLGEHRGLAHYTVGQRRGLGIGGPGGPLFVVRIIPEQNALIVGPEQTVWLDECDLDDLRMVGQPPGECFEATVATRYRGQETPAQVKLTGEDRAQVRFHRPHRAPAPGQSAVFYDGERCLGGGIIRRPST